MEISEAVGPKESGAIVSSLQHALGEGEHGLKHVPGLIKRTLQSRAWKSRIVRETKQEVSFTRFADFVSAPLVEGLGANLEIIRKLIRDDPEALSLFDQAVQGKPGNPSGANQYQSGTVDNIHDSTRPTGTSAQAALRRLRKNRPDLLKRVEAGELSAHSAMIEAGFLKSTLTIQPTVQGFARAINAKLSTEQRSELRNLI